MGSFVSSLMIAIFMWPTPARSQPTWEVALKLGPNAAVLDEEARFHRLGVMGGLAGHRQLTLHHRFSLGGQAEVLFTPRGSRTISEGEYLGRSRYYYLDSLIALRPQVQLNSTQVYLLVGGGASLLLRAKKENATGQQQDITDSLHRLDVTLLFGLGVGMRLPPRELGPLRLGTIFLEARHDRGLRDTNLGIGGYKNRTTSLMLGLAFEVTQH